MMEMASGQRYFSKDARCTAYGARIPKELILKQKSCIWKINASIAEAVLGIAEERAFMLRITKYASDKISWKTGSILWMSALRAQS